MLVIKDIMICFSCSKFANNLCIHLYIGLDIQIEGEYFKENINFLCFDSSRLRMQWFIIHLIGESEICTLYWLSYSYHITFIFIQS